MHHKNKAETQALVSKIFDIPICEKIATKHQSDDSVRIEMTFSKDQWQKIQKMQEILSRSLKSKDLSAAIL